MFLGVRFANRDTDRPSQTTSGRRTGPRDPELLEQVGLLGIVAPAWLVLVEGRAG